MRPSSAPLREVAPDLARALKRPVLYTAPVSSLSVVKVDTVSVVMRDGIRLATDLYLPDRLPAPTIVIRTPYGRATDVFVGAYCSFARRGYVVVSQDCRGTGESEPEDWDYYMFEPDDSFDTIEWISQQRWCNGFISACGGSYVGQVQWQMGLHPRMSAIVPDVSGLGIAVNHAHLHMFANAYAKTTGKGPDKISVPLFDLEEQILPETLSTGYFNAPLDSPAPPRLVARYPHLTEMSHRAARLWLWRLYCDLSCAERAQFVKEVFETASVTILEVELLSNIFGREISHDRHTLPRVQPEALCSELHPAILMRTGWYDWGLNDALATWDLLVRAAPESLRSKCRLIIGPNAHSAPGYHENMVTHPELMHAYGVSSSAELLLQWYRAVEKDKLAEWPRVIFYLMGAQEWRAADAWPPSGTVDLRLYLSDRGVLSRQPPEVREIASRYTYDPAEPTPTVGGSILSFVYPPGSVDVSDVQQRSDVLIYTTEPLEHDIDVVGPLTLTLFVSSTVIDTDFVGRLSDVFPDGRAIQLQNGLLRTRYRNPESEPAPLEPGRIYELHIDLWATASRFKAGHRIRVDISSADFPRFDRNNNRGGEPGDPLPAVQTIYHDASHPSHIVLPVLRSS